MSEFLETVIKADAGHVYDKDAAYASSLYVLTTLLSIVTMPVMVGMYEMFV